MGKATDGEPNIKRLTTPITQLQFEFFGPWSRRSKHDSEECSKCRRKGGFEMYVSVVPPNRRFQKSCMRRRKGGFHERQQSPYPPTPLGVRGIWVQRPRSAFTFKSPSFAIAWGPKHCTRLGVPSSRCIRVYPSRRGSASPIAYRTAVKHYAWAVKKI